MPVCRRCGLPVDAGVVVAVFSTHADLGIVVEKRAGAADFYHRSCYEGSQLR